MGAKPAPAVWPGAFFAGVHSMYNNWLIWFFFGMVILDIITGIAKSLITKKVDSSIGVTGLTKHFIIVFATMIIYPFLDATEFDQVGNTWVIFYIVFYGVSFAENWGQMGLPLPPGWREYLNKLSKTTEGKNHDKSSNGRV